VLAHARPLRLDLQALQRVQLAAHLLLLLLLVRDLLLFV
jgi:hypothetical protein